VHIAIIGPNKVKSREQVFATAVPELENTGPTPGSLPPPQPSQGAGSQLGHEGGMTVGKGVEVEVEVQLRGFRLSRVGPADLLMPFDQVGYWIEAHVDGVLKRRRVREPHSCHQHEPDEARHLDTDPRHGEECTRHARAVTRNARSEAGVSPQQERPVVATGRSPKLAQS
jgi:hypothetical protein